MYEGICREYEETEGLMRALKSKVEGLRRPHGTCRECEGTEGAGGP